MLALDEQQQYPLEKASTLDLLGSIKLAKYDMEASGNNFREALQIRLNHLSQINPNHPDIGVSYLNIGKHERKSSSIINAEKNLLHAADIFRHNYPTTHPLVIETAQCLEDIKRELGH